MKKSLFYILLGVMLPMCAYAKTVTDMAGREVVLPDAINKVYAPSPYGSYILYAMNPSLMAGWVMNIQDKDKPYLAQSARDLPVIGSITGQGQTSNLEIFFANKPDLILMWASSQLQTTGNVQDKLDKIGVPYVFAVAERMEDYPKVFDFLGNALQRPERGKLLSNATQKILDDVTHAVSLVPHNERPKVYYAEGKDGLATECHDSIHVEILKILGDVDVHRCHTSNHKGFEKVTIEQVLLYSPDVIITQDEEFINNVYTLDMWKNVKAVKNRRVYLIPNTPFNWFDRPPSFMRFLGLQWLANLLYPTYYPIDIQAETKKFYDLFIGISLDEKTLHVILSPKSLAPKE